MAENKQRRTKETFEVGIADVSLSHLLELMRTLRAYKDGIVLVGGWVPYLLLMKFQQQGTDFQHVGSKDIDLALNPEIVDDKKYATIRELIKERGFKSKEGSTFSFVKEVIIPEGKKDLIQVDFLGPEYGGTGKNRRHQRVQDEFLLRKARGVDVVFDHTLDLELVGQLPNGAKTKEQIKMADIVGILALKGITLGSRYKEKDAYDIYSLVAYYKRGPESLEEEIKPHLKSGLVKEGIEEIKKEFGSREDSGPTWVADFMNEEGEAKEQRITDVYMQIKKFIELLKVK